MSQEIGLRSANRRPHTHTHTRLPRTPSHCLGLSKTGVAMPPGATFEPNPTAIFLADGICVEPPLRSASRRPHNEPVCTSPVSWFPVCARRLFIFMFAIQIGRSLDGLLLRRDCAGDGMWRGSKTSCSCAETAQGTGWGKVRKPHAKKDLLWSRWPSKPMGVLKNWR